MRGAPRYFPVPFLLCLTVVCGGFLAILGGCGGRGDRNDEVTVRFWNGFTGPDGRTMLTLVKQFNEENPDVRVVMQRMEWAVYYNKLFVAGLGGRAPDVFVVHSDVVTRFHQAGFLRPVGDLMASGHGIDLADFDANVLAAVQHEGELYGVPLDVHLLGLFYNRKLFREADIVDAQGQARPPVNREEFLEALRKLKKVGEGKEGDVWGFVFAWYRTNLYTLLRQFEGEIFSEDPRTTSINSPENVEALEFAVNLIHEHRLVPAPEAFDAWIGFRQGRVGMIFEGIYMVPELLRQGDLDYGAAPLPLLGSKRAAWGNSHNLCLRSDLDERELDASWRFIRFLSDNSLDWAEGGQIPVRKSLRETERFRGMVAQREFANQIPDMTYTPAVPYVFEYIAEFDLAMERALRGRMSPKESLDQAAVNIERIIARYQGTEERGEER